MPAENFADGFYREKVVVGLCLMSGEGRILAVWKPTGRAEFEGNDLLHFAIMEAHVLPGTE